MTRRDLLNLCGMGMPALALAPMLDAAGVNPLAARHPPLAPRAKRVIHIFMNGGPSQVDTFDPKPMLATYAGREIPIHLRTERKTGAAYPSPFEFKRHGQSGIEVSEIFPHVARHVDDLCVVRSMHTNIPNHEPSLLMMNCGAEVQSRPSFGSWVTYGLGTENQNLPGFIALCPGGLPVRGTHNWRASFLPGAYQGTHIDTRESAIDRLVANIRPLATGPAAQRRQLDLLAEMNRAYAAGREDDAMLDARVQSFELAYRMQMEASDVFDLSREPASVREMYGDTVYGRQMLMARRLLERGVRFVQVWHGAGQPWDAHNDVKANHAKNAGECDQPIAALLADLKQRGLFNDTLVIWGGEFGRTPTVELAAFGSNLNGDKGRDHNSYGFTMWLAGGGVRGGHIHGATDEFGFRAVEQTVHVHDLHATLLHLLGFDHEKFTYRHAGRDFRLTDVHGRVVRELLA
ncbi:MAG: DUF1501 domain-containing protein [Acidobacteria bacterium]|nr:DUF1501 domain-containing protein [Acidobacteriota bacterium]